jgi:hypothetical protein
VSACFPTSGSLLSDSSQGPSPLGLSPRGEGYRPIFRTMAEHPDALPTPRSTLRAHYVRVLVWCKACRHQANADLQALLDAGRGDVPLNRLRFRCANCRSRLTDFLVTSRDNPQP